jgi:glutathione S-transferase
MMLTFFHSPDSRSSRLLWLLEELGAKYELAYTDIARRSGRGAPDPANPHPDKQVPALVHDGALITETSAIALYLTDLLPAASLGATVGNPGRGAYLTWLAYHAGEIEPAFDAKASGRIEHDRWAVRAFDRVLKRVFAAVESGPYILGEQFSAADILVASQFQWYREMVPENARLDAWLERLSARPAAKRAAALDGWPNG